MAPVWIREAKAEANGSEGILKAVLLHYTAVIVGRVRHIEIADHEHWPRLLRRQLQHLRQRLAAIISIQAIIARDRQMEIQ